MLFSEAINQALDESLNNKDVLLCGQLVNYSHSALTSGLERKHPNQVITYPVSENLMNSSAMGLSLAGKRPIVLHERFDFALVGMDALVNHIPLYRGKLPLVMMIVVGHGKGQGPQQNKDFTDFFMRIKGWSVLKPKTPEAAYRWLKLSVADDKPTMYVVQREMFNVSG